YQTSTTPSHAQQLLGLGDHAHHVGAALDLLVEPLQRVGRPNLLHQTFFQWLTGNEVKASSFSALLRNMISSLGNWRPSMSAITSSCSRTWWASGWAKIVRMAAATISAEPSRGINAGVGGVVPGRPIYHLPVPEGATVAMGLDEPP